MKENRKQLREEMAVPLMWRAWMRKTITDDQILAYFEKHREKLDGTKIRVSHILLKSPPGTSEAESERKATELKDLRGEIVSGKQSFEEAAKAKSEAPSGKEGGAIGTISWEGAMPDSFCEVAFQLPINELSEPFRTHFGWHLCVVKEKIPGDLSVEDARREIIAKVSEEEWGAKTDRITQFGQNRTDRKRNRRVSSNNKNTRERSRVFLFRQAGYLCSPGSAGADWTAVGWMWGVSTGLRA